MFNEFLVAVQDEGDREGDEKLSISKKNQVDVGNPS